MAKEKVELQDISTLEIPKWLQAKIEAGEQFTDAYIVSAKEKHLKALEERKRVTEMIEKRNNDKAGN